MTHPHPSLSPHLLPRPDRLTLAVGVADVLASYVYAFVVNALTPPSGPHAPATYWLTQGWVYLLIAPFAAVATWQALRHFAAFRAGDRRWWRLPIVGATCGAGGGLLMVPASPTLAIAVWSIAQLAIICGGLGLLLICINYPLARRSLSAAQPRASA